MSHPPHAGWVRPNFNPPVFAGSTLARFDYSAEQYRKWFERADADAVECWKYRQWESDRCPDGAGARRWESDRGIVKAAAVLQRAAFDRRGVRRPLIVLPALRLDWYPQVTRALRYGGLVFRWIPRLKPRLVSVGLWEGPDAEQKGPPHIYTMAPIALAVHLDRIAAVVELHTTEKIAAQPQYEAQRIDFPKRLAIEWIGGGGLYALPRLCGVSQAPFKRDDGSIAAGGGYDPISGMWIDVNPPSDRRAEGPQ